MEAPNVVILEGENAWKMRQEAENTSTVKVDKEDPRAKMHYLKTDIRDGKEVKIWECGLCGKEFRFQYTLLRHIPTHTDVRNFHCDTCPKAFRQLSTLAQHRATHLNRRPFFCDICNKSFNRVSTLISHRKIHSNDKRHICHICNKGFHQKGNLRNHIYTHTNERPYKCEICEKGFNQKSNLVCHKTSAHGKKNFFHCVLCSMRFVSQQNFSSHMATSHKISAVIEEGINKQDCQERKIGIEENDSLALPYLSMMNENGVTGLAQVTEKPQVPSNENSKRLANISGHAVLAEIKHKPTSAMLRLKELGQIPFVLLYRPGERHPKICKAVIEDDKYYLVNPRSGDIEKYFTPNNKNLLYHKFPIVSTVIQKYDSQNKLQTLVLPAGLRPQLVDSSLGASVEKNGENSKTPITKIIGSNTGLERTLLVQINQAKEGSVNCDTKLNICENNRSENLRYKMSENNAQYLSLPTQENQNFRTNEKLNHTNQDIPSFEFVALNEYPSNSNEGVQLRIHDNGGISSAATTGSLMETLNAANRNFMNERANVLSHTGYSDIVSDLNGGYDVSDSTFLSSALEKQKPNCTSLDNSIINLPSAVGTRNVEVRTEPMIIPNFSESECPLMENYKIDMPEDEIQNFDPLESFDKCSQLYDESFDLPMDLCLSESFLDDITNGQLDEDMMHFSDIDFQLGETEANDFKDNQFDFNQV